MIKHLALFLIQLIAVHHNPVVVILIDALDDIVYAQHQLLWGKGLRDIVIASFFQTDDTVKFLISGRHENNRDIPPLKADFLNQIKTALVIQHDIQNP